MVPAFDFHLRTRIVFGPGKLSMLGQLARQLGAQRVLVVSDPGIVAAGHTARGLQTLTEAGCTAELFDGARENPTTREVEAGAEVARAFRPDLLVGLGGGSSMDCAKGINFLYTNGGKMQDYWGIGKATKPMLPMIAVPTTAGTGSETQSFALISDPETHVKMACGDKKASCAVALLDPELTLTQPARVTALAGIDAIAHAVETAVTKPRTAMSLLFSHEAWRLLAPNFPRVVTEPNDIEARASMQLGASLAGIAIENSMLGAAHALANPLTARFDIPHGQAVGLMLPHVVRFNGAVVNQDYSHLLARIEGRGDVPPPDSGAEGLAQFLSRLLELAGLASRLSELNVDSDLLPACAEDAAKQWTGTFNPRPLSVDDFLNLYRSAW
ncbi:MAG: iron alcohol dehydrogenase [Pirellulaceae bacterium]|nr:MAG: iron alcohol dehydrogenase [Pirellulaceae bacterium]